jgi:hypothetical protein
MFQHPQVHCIVPGGGIAPDGRWVTCRPSFFLPMRVLSRLYRHLFLARLVAAFENGALQFSVAEWPNTMTVVSASMMDWMNKMMPDTGLQLAPLTDEARTRYGIDARLTRSIHEWTPFGLP